MTDVHPPLTPSNEYLDPDDVGLRSPPLKPMKVNLQPSPSPPPAVPLPDISPESSPEPPGRKGSSRPKYRSSQGDAVLVAFMAGGNHSDIARAAGDKPLASDNEEGDEPVKGTKVEVSVGEEKKEAWPEENGIALAALAADALRQTAKDLSEPAPKEATPGGIRLSVASSGESTEGLKPTIPSIITLYVDPPGAKPSSDTTIKHEISGPPTAGELPPIRQHSPKSAMSNGTGASQITLPSISDQLGDINILAEAAPAGDSAFSQSPPARPPPRFPTAPGHGSPPKSPNDAYRRELPSPGRFYFNASSHRRPSQPDGPQYSSAGDYSSSNTETPSTDQSISTPATVGIDRMSIDGITNPQIGGFQCTYPGCTAQPFQTQYLLNSHANVHSSNRPHYCPIKGCPRSEGGKGFKRKNEMIRHGLVHDSPGYVCPFCPDREHKYPRPDNLQRHVRVHHVDKDKDDPLLREVLSQRPEGPSRGRRRRGGTS